jgi:hypothetical protein
MSFEFVKQHNIDHFERLLGVETDPVNRARIERLLAEERVKDYGGGPPAGAKPTPDGRLD